MIMCMSEKTKTCRPLYFNGIHAIIVSASGAKSVQDSPLVTTLVHGFKTRAKQNSIIKNGNNIAQ